MFFKMQNLYTLNCRFRNFELYKIKIKGNIISRWLVKRYKSNKIKNKVNCILS